MLLFELRADPAQLGAVLAPGIGYLLWGLSRLHDPQVSPSPHRADIMTDRTAAALRIVVGFARSVT